MNNAHDGRLENVHHLRVFMAVAQSLSFTRAAESLFLTQSAVSHQIADLEQTVGAKLFDRSGRTIRLTRAGEALLTQSARVFSALEEAEAAVRHAINPDIGRIRIGASSTACQYIVPAALREFRECFPGYSMVIIPGDSPTVTDHLLSGAIDLGILIRSERRQQLDYHDLFEDELQFLVSPHHPWARAGRVDRTELADQKLVLYTRHSATFRIIERYFFKMKAPLRDWLELGEMGAIKELVKLGLGVSITADWVAQPEVENQSLVLLPTPGAKLKRVWCVATAFGRVLSVAEQTFVALCQSAAEHLPARK